MTREEAKSRVEFTWRNILRTCYEVNNASAWAFAHDWCRSKEGGRNPVLGRRGDNDWCFQDIPESKRIYDPALSRNQEREDPELFEVSR